MDLCDRRRFPRFEGPFQVDLLNMGDDPQIPPTESIVPATALDISKEGLRLKSHYAAAVGSFVSAIVYFKGQGSVCLCEIKWKREDGNSLLYGLYVKEWCTLDPSLARKLKELENNSALSQETPPSGSAVATSLILI